jgi:general secretion pathway protein J
MTLVEVVVAMAVLSLVVLVLGASLRSMAQSSQRIDERVDAIDEMRVGIGFLREVLGRVTPVRVAPPGEGLLFTAAPQELAWVAVMPARFGAAGRHHFRLAVETLDDGSSGLVLRYAPWTGEAVPPEWAQAEARVLVPQVTAFELRYGGEGVAAGWLPAWPPDDPDAAARERNRPPPRIRLDLASATYAWPPVILPVRVQSARGAAAGGFVIGGTTQ